MSVVLGPTTPADIQQVALKLIGLAYDAAVDPKCWDEFLAVYENLYPGASQWLWLEDSERQDVRIITNEACDASFIPSYQEYYATKNIWTDVMLGLPEGHTHMADWLLPGDVLEQSEFYADWLKPQDVRFGFGACLLKEGRHSMFYSLLHSKAYSTDETQDLELLRLLVPHMQRAAKLHVHLLGLEEQRDDLEEAVNLLSVGVIMLSDRGEVLMMNRRAQRILAARDGLALAGRRVTAAAQGDREHLARAIAATLAMAGGGPTTAAGAVAISRPSGLRPYALMVTPCMGNRENPSSLSLIVPAARVALFLRDPEDQSAPSDDLLKALYGLTPAEARLASALAEGGSLDKVAEQLAITKETARSQLKSVYSKTDTHKQGALIRLIINSAGGV